MNHPISLPTKLEIAYLHDRNLTQSKIADEELITVTTEEIINLGYDGDNNYGTLRDFICLSQRS